MSQQMKKRAIGWWLAAVFGLSGFGACAAMVSSQRTDDPGPAAEESAAGSQPAPWEPQVPAPSAESWRLPQWERSAPYFPYLPGEDRTRSRSVGGVSHGWLVNSVRIPQPHPHLAVLDLHLDVATV